MSALVTFPTGRLIERFTINPPDSAPLVGKLYQCTYRKSGRRIVVEEEDGTPVYDTESCFDLGNATNKLDLWLMDRYHSLRPQQKAGC